jgi:hypothetical protein
MTAVKRKAAGLIPAGPGRKRPDRYRMARRIKLPLKCPVGMRRDAAEGPALSRLSLASDAVLLHSC